MSDLLADKVIRFDRLNERERKILDELMANPSVKIREVCDRLGEPEQTVRGALTSLYKKLDIPESERDKRGFLVREYQEAYQEKYLKVGEIAPNHPEPTIHVTPSSRQANRNAIVIGGIILMSVVVIGVLLIASNGFRSNTGDNCTSQILADGNPIEFQATDENKATFSKGSQTWVTYKVSTCPKTVIAVFAREVKLDGSDYAGGAWLYLGSGDFDRIEVFDGKVVAWISEKYMHEDLKRTATSISIENPRYVSKQIINDINFLDQRQVEIVDLLK